MVSIQKETELNNPRGLYPKPTHCTDLEICRGWLMSKRQNIDIMQAKKVRANSNVQLEFSSEIPKCLQQFLGLSDGTKACVLSNPQYCLKPERPLPLCSCAVNSPKRGFCCITGWQWSIWLGKIIINNICLNFLHVKKTPAFCFPLQMRQQILENAECDSLLSPNAAGCN